MKKATSAFEGLASVLGEGFGDLMSEGDQFAEVDLMEILVKPQVRDPNSFEDDAHTLADLSASIRKHKVFQPILIRPIEGAARPYELVAGERRYIASQMAGKQAIPAIIRVLDDEQARDIQLAENIQRKNLTYLEEAKRIQEDLDALGSVEAVLEKHSKSRAWLSKITSLLKLPEQTKRLISEKVSADLEVIGKVKAIEKIDPKAAKDLVDELKKTRGKEDARAKAEAVKAKVKPSSPQKIANKVAKKERSEALATKSNQPQDNTSETTIFADAKTGNNSPRSIRFAPVQGLSDAYVNIFEHGSSPKVIYDLMTDLEKDAVEGFLRGHYEAGAKTNDVGRSVIQGFRNGQFASDGEGAFALVAFLQGADPETKFNALKVLGSVQE